MFLFHLKLAAHDANCVGCDPGVKASTALHVRNNLFVEETLHPGQQFVVGWSVLHQPASIFHLPSSYLLPSSIRFRSSHSVSAVRRPMAASSIAGPALLTVPSRPARAWLMQMTPHRRLPNSSQKRTAAASTGRPPPASYACQNFSRVPSPPTGLSSLPKRQERTQIQPRSSIGSPTWASSQSRIARTPSGPKMTLPIR